MLLILDYTNKQNKQQIKYKSGHYPMGLSINRCCSSSERQVQPQEQVKKVITKSKFKTNSKEEIEHSEHRSTKVTSIDPPQQKQPSTPSIPATPPTPTPRKPTFSDFHIDGTIGQGSFGTVYKAHLRKTAQNQAHNHKYAIKSINKSSMRNKHIEGEILLERNIAMWKNIFISHLVMAFQDQMCLYMVMELAQGGDTFSLVNGPENKVLEFRGIGENGVRFLAACVIQGLQFMHSKGYIYCDLKPENVLLFGNGYAKLTDFGLAVQCQQGGNCSTIKGTKLYLAPQLVLDHKYDRSIDLWALGIYIFEISNFSMPFLPKQITATQFHAAYQQFQRGERWQNPNMSPQLEDLIRSLLKFKAGQRIGKNGFHELKQHKFFNNFDWQSLQNQSLPSPLVSLVQKYKTEPQKQKRVHHPHPLSPSKKNLQMFQNWEYYSNDIQV